MEKPHNAAARLCICPQRSDGPGEGVKEEGGGVSRRHQAIIKVNSCSLGVEGLTVAPLTAQTIQRFENVSSCQRQRSGSC